MADKNVEMQERNASNTGWDNIYPVTKIDNVKDAAGNSHMADYIRQPGYGITAGSANTYTLTLSPALIAYTAGVCVAVKIHAANTGASTLNINGLGAKSILDGKGNAMTSGKLRLNGIYTLRYDGTNFTLQGEGGSGNAIASDLLAGKTASTDAGDITGTMPVNGPAAAETVNLTTEGAEYTIAAGNHSGLRKIKAVISGLIASVVKAGTTVGGILGTFTSDATATAGQILSGITAYVNGNKITGTIPSKAAATITPSTANQTIAAGQYLSGAQTILGDADLISANIKAGANIFGVAGNANVVDTSAGTALASEILVNKIAFVDGVQVTGTIPDKTNNWTAPTQLTAYDGQLYANLAYGAYGNGGGALISDVDFLAANIKSGVNIFGLAGTFAARQYASGTLANMGFNTYQEYHGLTFTPAFVIVTGTPEGGSMQVAAAINFSNFVGMAGRTQDNAGSFYIYELYSNGFRLWASGQALNNIKWVAFA